MWQECQSNIWSSDTKTYMRLIITERNENCLQYVRVGKVSVIMLSLRVGVKAFVGPGNRKHTYFFFISVRKWHFVF